jgi:hypothetical protein
VDGLRELYWRLIELEALWENEALQTFAGGEVERGKWEIKSLQLIVIDAIGERDYQRRREGKDITVDVSSSPVHLQDNESNSAQKLEAIWVVCS